MKKQFLALGLLISSVSAFAAVKVGGLIQVNEQSLVAEAECEGSDVTTQTVGDFEFEFACTEHDGVVDIAVSIYKIVDGERILVWSTNLENTEFDTEACIVLEKVDGDRVDVALVAKQINNEVVVVAQEAN